MDDLTFTPRSRSVDLKSDTSDVDFETVKEVAGHITPVPGGVGLLTVTMLLRNTLTAARLQTGKNECRK